MEYLKKEEWLLVRRYNSHLQIKQQLLDNIESIKRIRKLGIKMEFRAEPIQKEG